VENDTRRGGSFVFLKTSGKRATRNLSFSTASSLANGGPLIRMIRLLFGLSRT
jgi:hypothetical protein